MDFLSSIFGYKGALGIKDFINFSNGIGVGGVIILHLMAQFYIQVDFDPNLRRDVALQRVSITPPEFYTSATNFGEVAEAFLAFILMKFSKEETMRFKKMRRISIVIKILGVSLFILGVLLSFYKYLPQQ